MKKWILALSLILPVVTQASGTVDFLEVDNDVVLFSTTATKTVTSPSSVSTDTPELWSASLESHSGRAIYSLILTSMAKDDSVGLNIESAGDCADKDGVERASKVSLVLVSNSTDISTSEAKGIGLYKGDGETRIGTVLGMGDDNASWYYAPVEGSATTLTIGYDADLTNDVFVYFRDADCKSYDYVRSSYKEEYVTNKGHNDGLLYEVDDTSVAVNTDSYYNADGECVNEDRDMGVYHLLEYVHPVCGDRPCIIK